MRLKIVVDGEVVHDVAKANLALDRPERKTLCGALYYCVGSLTTHISPTGNNSFVKCNAAKLRLFLTYDPMYFEQAPALAPRVPLLKRDQ